jgi:hypothetical protein
MGYGNPFDAHMWPMRWVKGTSFGLHLPEGTPTARRRHRRPNVKIENFPKHGLPGGLSCLGTGCYGGAYEIAVDEAMRWVASVGKLVHQVGDARSLRSLLPDGRRRKRKRSATLVCKLQTPILPSASASQPQRKVPREKFIEDAVNESQIHAYLTKAKRVVGGRRYVARRVVPRLFLAGFFVDGDGTLVHIQFMEKAGGVSLATLLENARKNGNRHQRDIVREIFPPLEKALVTLWACGVAHADVHAGNVMVSTTPRNKLSVSIIDFGRSFVIPGSVQIRVDEAISRGDVDGAWFASGLQEVATRTAISAGLNFLNPNGHYLRTLHRQHVAS